MRLLELAEAGELAAVVEELGTLTVERRATCAKDTAALREALQETRYQRPQEEVAAWYAADLGCQVTPETAADWLARHHQAIRPDAWAIDVLDLYPVAWQAELVARLDDQGVRMSVGWLRVVEHVVRTTGCPAPTTDPFLFYWLPDRAGDHGERPGHLRGGAPGANLAERLRADDFTPVLLPLIVAHPARFVTNRTYWLDLLTGLAADGLIDREELVRNLFADLANDPPHPHHGWEIVHSLALTPSEHALVADERAALVERPLGRLLQDGTRMETAPPLAFLRALAPAPAENAVVVRDHVALLDGSLPVAAYAQEILAGVDEAGLLEPDVLTEICERFLLRPEKKLVRAQLSWLDREIRRDPTRAARVLVDAAMAFDHRDASLQERALDVVARHLSRAGDTALPELRTAAGRLGPGLAERAAELLGISRDTDAVEQVADVLPVLTGPRPVPGPIATAVEVAQEVAAVVADDWDVVPFERALDGLVRHAHRDRGALSEALGPVVRRTPRERYDCTQSDLYDVARAVRGDEPRDNAVQRRGGSPYARVPSLAGAMLMARLTEAIDVIESGTQPFLLAVPTHTTGALDAAQLVARIRELEDLDITPAPVDLAQALLRVTPAPGEEALRSAERLRSDAGRRLARWLREGGLPRQSSHREGWREQKPVSSWEMWCTPTRPGVVVDPPFPSAAAALFGPYRRRKTSLGEPAAPFWVAQLPYHRDEVMARDYMESPQAGRGRTGILPLVAESGGPAEYAVHLTLALDMSMDQDAAVDALLVLAARGQLDSGLLGEQIEVLIRARWLESNRAHDALRSAADTGAYATVWSVLAAALPGLLRDTPVRGAGAFLSLGVVCASHCGAKGEIPEVTAVAERTGSSQLVKSARLLRDALR
ncbi:hypothetical protein JHN63_25525 [Streptomyces sp. MBT65]|uniref:DUF6493 family protein n=1 Tax=Streptomyces sp. MBT65 TaxID=1488395 RepID=UPI0019095EAB|nr:DUF6493 family protein [Streptomyces sp. MBT65]MBK3577102.1 hypothetical protein [Streptomyces sp. MBT65]